MITDHDGHREMYLQKSEEKGEDEEMNDVMTVVRTSHWWKHLTSLQCLFEPSRTDTIRRNSMASCSNLSLTRSITTLADVFIPGTIASLNTHSQPRSPMSTREANVWNVDGMEIDRVCLVTESTFGRTATDRGCNPIIATRQQRIPAEHWLFSRQFSFIAPTDHLLEPSSDRLFNRSSHQSIRLYWSPQYRTNWSCVFRDWSMTLSR